MTLRKESEELRNEMDRIKSEMRTSTAMMEGQRRDAEGISCHFHFCHYDIGPQQLSFLAAT
jgi:hypothetical protein